MAHFGRGFTTQLDLLTRAALTSCHGGLNTVLESLAVGVPTWPDRGRAEFATACAEGS